MSSIPTRTPEQRAEALAKAHATRQEKVRLRQGLKSRDITGAEVIEEAADHPIWGALKVLWLLESLPGVGPIRAERMMQTLDIAPSRRIQGLGERQRAALLARLAEGR